MKDGRQTASVYLAKGAELRSPEPVGTRIVSDAEVSFGAQPNIVKSGNYTFFWGTRSDAFFFDFDGIKNLFDIARQAELHRATPHPRQIALDRRRFEHRGQRVLDSG